MTIIPLTPAAGSTVFSTVCLAHRNSDLLVREVERLRIAVRQTKQNHPFDILAWVTLPDHLHCVWRLPEGDLAVGQRWGRIKSRFTKSVRDADVDLVQDMKTNAERLFSGSQPVQGAVPVWQKRFWQHHIRGAAEIEHHVQYCWNAPVRQGLVAQPQDWEFSSIHRDIKLVA